MNLPDLSHNPLITAFGWTLLHSLWQFSIISLTVSILLRFAFGKSPQIKYGIACSGLIAAVVSSSFTFIMLLDEKPSGLTSPLFFGSFQSVPQSVEASSAFAVNAFIGSIQTHIEWIVFGWMIGAGIFSCRLIGGWWYMNKLRTASVALNNDLTGILKNLSIKLGVKKVIALAESAVVHSPMVTGYLKPIIIFPAGLISGLTTAQVETILLHELAHIRRQDYLINIIQSFIEAIYFFNPFIWTLSRMLRREREFCCDDAVVQHHANALDYARALAIVEQSRISGMMPGLSLADNKNHLLIRIRRIMERSFNTENGNNKFLPLALVVVGLACASWLTITVNDHPISARTDATSPDTTIRKNKVERKNTKPLSRPSPLTAPDPAVPMHLPEQIELSATPVIGLDLPEIVVAPSRVAPSIPPIPAIEPDIYLNLDLDTLPPHRMFRDNEWEKFSEAFESKFRERFDDFFEKNEDELSKMLSELKATLHDEILTDAGHGLLIPDMPEIANVIQNELFVRQEEMKARQKELESIQEDLQIRNEMMREQQLALREHLEMKMNEQEHGYREVEKNLRQIEEEMKNFENALKEELIKDGYLSSDENITSMKWDDNGDIVINGTRISDSDKGKYNELHKKFLQRQNKPIQKIE